MPGMLSKVEDILSEVIDMYPILYIVIYGIHFAYRRR
jgi:hypothetical protein